MVEMNHVVNTDAFELLKNIDDASIDLLFLDPDYQDWNDLIEQGIINESIRCLKDTGNILCFTKQPFDYELRIAVNDYFRREIYWTFENGGAWVSKKMPLVSCQKIYWLVKTFDFFFNPRTGLPYNEKTRDFKRNAKVFGGYNEEGRNFSMSDDGTWLRDHLHFNKPCMGGIPAKPKELVNIFVNCFCPIDGVVCDPFSGSGIIPMTALKTGRKFVASEKNEARANDINKSLKEATWQTTIFDFLEA